MSQLKELNTGIQIKNRKIRSTYKSMQKVRVYFVVDITLNDGEHIVTSKELTASKAEKLFDWLAISKGYTYRLRRVQTGGYCGGIIMGGSSETLKIKELK